MLRSLAWRPHMDGGRCFVEVGGGIGRCRAAGARSPGPGTKTKVARWGLTDPRLWLLRCSLRDLFLGDLESRAMILGTSELRWRAACLRRRKRRCNSTVWVWLEEPCCTSSQSSSLSRALFPSRPGHIASGNCAGRAKLGGGICITCTGKYGARHRCSLRGASSHSSSQSMPLNMR